MNFDNDFDEVLSAFTKYGVDFIEERLNPMIKKKKPGIKTKSAKWFVAASRTKKSTADFSNPLDLDTILQLSKKGMLKEKKLKPGKVA